MKTYTNVLHECANGTSLQGTIQTSYAKLKEIFGKHNSKGDEYKISTEWVLKDNYGKVLTIYDWKSTKTYDKNNMGIRTLRTLDSYEWHIGARCQEDADGLINYINARLK